MKHLFLALAAVLAVQAQAISKWRICTPEEATEFNDLNVHNCPEVTNWFAKELKLTKEAALNEACWIRVTTTGAGGVELEGVRTYYLWKLLPTSDGEASKLVVALRTTNVTSNALTGEISKQTYGCSFTKSFCHNNFKSLCFTQLGMATPKE